MPVRYSPLSSRLRGLGAGVLASVLILLLALPAASLGEVLPVDSALEAARKDVVSAFALEGYPQPEVPECPRVENAAFEGAVLIGASTAEPFDLLEGTPPFIVLASTGLSPRTALQDKAFTIDGKKVTLREKLAEVHPRAIYLWLGVNGLDYKSAEDVLADYDQLIKLIVSDWPNVPIYVMELSPVKAKLAARKEGFTNQRVLDYNAGVLELARKYNLYFLPIHALLCTPRGELSNDYGTGDGLHLRAAAYQVISDYLYTHVVPLPHVAPETAEGDPANGDSAASNPPSDLPAKGDKKGEK